MTFPLRRVLAAVASCSLLSAALADMARADDLADTAVIANGSFGSARGSVHVNEAAGNGNVQGNFAAVATGAALPLKRFAQQTDAAGAGGGRASIQDFAFSGASGLLQLNQSAGTGNAQGNAAILRVGVPASQMNDDALAAALPVQQAAPGSTRAEGVTDRASAAAHAFAHSSGVVQINQCAGAGNSTANGFILQVQKGVVH
jgi:hypothetical protein